MIAPVSGEYGNGEAFRKEDLYEGRFMVPSPADLRHSFCPGSNPGRGCGSTASPTEPPSAPAPQAEAQPEPTVAPETMGIAPTAVPAAPQASESSSAPAAPSPTATPVPAAMPEKEMSGKDSIVVVIPTEPDALSPWSTGSAETSSIVSYNWGEPLVWLDTTSLELGPTTSTTGWEQVAPDRWRFSLREGVQFVNGEPWNAETAAWNINHNGDPQIGLGFGVHGPLTGTVVDEHTIDITCAHANYNDGASQSCPILPADITGVAFQARSGGNLRRTTFGTGRRWASALTGSTGTCPVLPWSL